MESPHNISPDFRWNKNDAQTFKKILEHEATPEAIKVFARFAYRMTDYGYWFGLGTLWVSYTGFSDLELWKQLFSSRRSNRDTSLMKPKELLVWQDLPEVLTLYRAHRQEEQDWISYALLPEKAAEFALRRGVREVKHYLVKKSDALCLFLRRGETEVLVLDKSKAEYVSTIPVIFHKGDEHGISPTVDR